MSQESKAQVAARQVVRLLERAPLPYVTERHLQDGAAARLEVAGLEVRREVQIVAGRLDLLALVAGVRVAVEVKTRGSLGDLIAQLHRYAQSGEVDAVVALVGRSRLVVDAHEVGPVPVLTCLPRGF